MTKNIEKREMLEFLEGLMAIASAYYTAIETGKNIEGNTITLEELEVLSRNMGEEIAGVSKRFQEVHEYHVS